MYFGYQVAFGKFGPVAEKYGELTEAIKATRPEESLSFMQSLARMFSVEKLPSEAHALIAETMALWKSFWLLPSMMAVAILALFFIAFWDRTKVGDEE